MFTNIWTAFALWQVLHYPCVCWMCVMCVNVVHALEYVHMQRPEEDAGHRPLSISTFLSWDRVFHSLGNLLFGLAWASRLLRPACSCPCVGVTGMHIQGWLFMGVLWIWPWVLTLDQEVLLPSESHLQFSNVITGILPRQYIPPQSSHSRWGDDGA